MSQATLSERPYVNSNLFSGHYLDERVQERDEWDCDEEARQAMDDLQTLYELEGSLVEGYGEDALIDNWIDEVLDVLGFGTQDEVTLPDGGGFVDELLFETPTARRDAAEVYLSTGDTTDLFERGIGIVEAKQWDAAFNVQFSEQRPYRNASHQTKHYLENTPPNIQWGILTNGRKWRLYGTNDYETQTYYEVDLPELLERGNLETFKYFYVFFRPAAFHEAAGTTFLDEVWSESETASQELGENLQDNVFTALRVLGRGFVETNDDLDIDPNDDEALDELKEQSLVFLYRLMFVLYAEARGLIHPENQSAQDDYEENFSLNALRLEIHDEIGEVDEGFEDAFSEYSTGMWGRLEDLFRLIDEGEEDLGIPPYNGGLFDHVEHQFLTEHEVSNRYLAEVIYRLSTTQNGEGRYVLADYADLDTRHLGSVYEGLLEHQFRIAPEQYAAVADNGGQVWKPATEVSVAEAVETVPAGGLYVVNDEGERKATGTYYTPDYVVTYIVEETVEPLVKEIREDLINQGFEPGTQEYIGPFYRRVTDLRILDPAMGSGHFLTKATGYLSEQVMAEVREAETEFGVAFNEQHVRREIAKECIYGVDVNRMAVELAKLSMWLETLAADRPLAFLDHHLKTGNSLVGSDIEDILTQDDSETENGQLTLQQSFAHTRQKALEHVMERFTDLLSIDNETLEDIKKMEEVYEKVREDDLYQHLLAMANVRTAEEFDLNVPSDADERMAEALRDDSWAEIEEQDWFRTAQTMAEEEAFFHWELEFPVAFYNSEGTRKDNAGFDAVVSNPPYIRIQNLRREQPMLADYLKDTPRYTSTEARFDIYAPFVEQGIRLTRDNHLSYILPNKFFKSDGGKGLREFLSETRCVSEIVDFGHHQVFSGAITYTCILSLRGSSSRFNYIPAYEGVEDVDEIRNLNKVDIDIQELGSDPWILTGPREKAVLDKMTDNRRSVGQLSEFVSQGLVTGDNNVLFVDIINIGDEFTKVRSQANGETYHIESELVHPVIDGDDVSRYSPPQTNIGVIYPYKIKNGDIEIITEKELEGTYPGAYRYLTEFQDRLSSRGSESMNYQLWYALWRPREKRLWESPKILHPRIVNQSEFTLDDDGGLYLHDSGYAIVPKDNTQKFRHYLLAILNSTATWFYLYMTSPVIENDFRQPLANYLTPIPVPDAHRSFTEDEFKTPSSDFVDLSTPLNEIHETDESGELLAHSARNLLTLHRRRASLNLDILDYLGNYGEGPRLPDVGLFQPTSSSILVATTEEYEKLRIGSVQTEREGNQVTVYVTTRYKPEDKDEFETDQWGYTETEYLKAFSLTNLTGEEATLVEEFVPVAAEEADGFANFRDNATKTNSPIDRLKAIVLPDPDDVADDLHRYIKVKKRAKKLDEKIEKINELIDEIVYELYGLTDEEIEIVEQAVGE